MPCCRAEKYGWCGDVFRDYPCTGDDGQDYCVFHAPRGKKKMSLEDFNGVVLDTISDLRKERGLYGPEAICDLSGTVFEGDIRFEGIEDPLFPEMNFKEAEFTGNANFAGVQFAGKANFEKATFTGEVEFRGTQFDGETSFGKARFLEEVRLYDARFAETVDLEEASRCSVVGPTSIGSVLGQRLSSLPLIGMPGIGYGGGWQRSTRRQAHGRLCTPVSVSEDGEIGAKGRKSCFLWGDSRLNRTDLHGCDGLITQ